MSVVWSTVSNAADRSSNVRVRVNVAFLSFAQASPRHAVLFFYARWQNASRVLAMAWASVRLSVRPSVTLLYCIKTVQARITESSMWVAPRTLVFLWRNFMPLGEGISLELGRQRGVAPPPKRRYFADIGSCSVKTVADRYRHGAYHNKHWWQAF